MPELTDHVHAEIQRLCAEGDALAGRRDYPKALRTYWAAWDMLGIEAPKKSWKFWE